jgi:hypothetical protein
LQRQDKNSFTLIISDKEEVCKWLLNLKALNTEPNMNPIWTEWLKPWPSSWTGIPIKIKITRPVRRMRNETGNSFFFRQ